MTTNPILIFPGLKCNEIGRCLAFVIPVVLVFGFFGYVETCPYLWVCFIGFYLLNIFVIGSAIFVVYLIIYAIYQWLKDNWQEAQYISMQRVNDKTKKN